jgi:hypothetical protein
VPIGYHQLMNTALFTLPTFENAVLDVVSEPGKMDELHLYHGSHCNRECAFCCVNGAPDGWHMPFTAAVLEAAVSLVARQGSLKIYGGEPTLDPKNLRWTVACLRQLGFAGAITIFSNGLRPRVLTDLLDADPGVRIVLNYAIATGTGERPLPPAALARLQVYHDAHPGRLFLSHAFVVPVGKQVEIAPAAPDVGTTDAAPSSTTPQKCYRCYPTLTSAGQFHACPFAVEYPLAHFALGDVQTPPEVVKSRFTHFLNWIDARLDPEAARQNRPSCAVCTGPASPAFESAGGE